MSPATHEEGTKAVGALSVGTDTTVITSIINHHSSKGSVSGDRTSRMNKALSAVTETHMKRKQFLIAPELIVSTEGTRRE